MIIFLFFLINFFTNIDAMETHSAQQMGIYITNNSDQSVEVGNLTDSLNQDSSIPDVALKGQILFSPIKEIQPKMVEFFPGLTHKDLYLIEGKFPCKYRESKEFKQFMYSGKFGYSSYQANVCKLGNFTGLLKINGDGFFLVFDKNRQLIRRQELPNGGSYSVEQYKTDIQRERIREILEIKESKFNLVDIPTLKELCCAFVITQKLGTQTLPGDLKEKILDIKMAQLPASLQKLFRTCSQVAINAQAKIGKV